MRLCVRFEIEKDLENGPRVYEREKKEKKGKSENNIIMHFCTMIAYMLIMNGIRVLRICWECYVIIHTRIYL